MRPKHGIIKKALEEHAEGLIRWDDSITITYNDTKESMMSHWFVMVKHIQLFVTHYGTHIKQ